MSIKRKNIQLNNESNPDADLEYIKRIFDDDEIRAPESLSEESIFALIEDVPQRKDSTIVEFSGADNASGSYDRRRHSRRISPAIRKLIFAIAACFIIAAISVPVINSIMSAPPDTSLVNGELRTFDSYGQIRRLVRSMDSGSSGGIHLLDLGRSDETMDIMPEDAVSEAELYDSAAPSDMTAGGSASSKAASKSIANEAAGSVDSAASSHSSTYLQVDDVDEADIVKTDGKYIYYVTDREELVILSAKNGKTKLLSRIGSSGVENYIHDIYLKGDTLVTIGRTYSGDEGSTAIVTYDITDRSHPEMISEFRQSGDIVSSRMVGQYVYLVTTDYVYPGGRMIPKCTSNGKYADIPADEIRCMPDPQRSSYVILSSVDIKSGKTVNAKTCAVFGATDDIYCNDHNLYTASTEYNSEKNSWYTRIARAEIDGLGIRFSATASVRGNILNQFSMDEYKGYFRIATTSQRDGMDVNNLFVLDSKLNTCGEISGFARNESIKSVRFMGDTAYVITYQAIDPLFVIDLSHPDDPEILGEVKIDGFSSQLVPIGNNKLLGIGYATGDNGYGGEYAAGLKLALFDTSDPAEPKVIDSREFENMDSPAQNTHLALTVNSEKGYYAIPYSVEHYEEFIDDEPDDIVLEDSDDLSAEGEEYQDEEITEDEPYVPDSEYESGVLVFSADEKIKVIDQHKLGSDYRTRCVYIGDYIYAMDNEGDAAAFKTDF